MRAALFALLFSVLACGSPGRRKPAGACLERISEIPLAAIGGRLDHLAYDASGQRIFFAAVEEGAAGVVDLRKGAMASVLGGLAGAQGVAYLDAAGRLFVSAGDASEIALYYGRDLKLLKQIPAREDPDNLRVFRGNVFAGEGSGRGSCIVEYEPDGAQVASTSCDGHPEAFELEAKGSRIFVNVPTRDEIEVLDRENHTLLARWKLRHAAANFPMALDEQAGRLYVGCRRPACLLVYDTATGKEISRSDVVSDADDIWLDPPTGRIYVSGGGGSVIVFQRGPSGTLHRRQKAETPSGARTSLFVPKTRRLYVAAPRRGDAPASIIVFALKR